MVKKNNGYDDETEEVMRYISVRATGEGKRVRIENPKGLSEYLKRLNDQERSAGKKPRMSTQFIRSVSESRKAQLSLPKVFGTFGNHEVTETYGVAGERRESIEDQRSKVKAEQLRREGKQVYKYEYKGRAGTAQRAVFKQKDKTRYQFRDEKGRFLPNKSITE